MFRNKKSNWQRLSSASPRKDPRYRDVHGEQQLERGERPQLKSSVPRTVASAIIGLLVAGAVYCVIALVSGFFNMIGSGESLLDMAFRPDWTPSLMNAGGALLAGGAVFALVYSKLMLQLTAQNAMADTKAINQHKDDQRVALPEEVQRRYDWFPDAAAHSSVSPNSLLSHMMLSNKGVHRVPVTVRHEADVLDEDGDILAYKGEAVLDDADGIVTKKMPLFDEQFADDLFDVSGALDDPSVRILFDTTKIPYNPKDKKTGKRGNRDKLDYDTVVDLINKDWYLPATEVMRPAGAYIVDTAPVNTMVLAMTRAGKGQTYIEAMIDMWLRESRLNNIVINDPKGELLERFYIPAVVRGMNTIQFNLMNVANTDVYNPLGLAVEAAQEGDFTKCAEYVKNIAGVFFPIQGSEDPVWPNAARNAFMRAAYGLIEFFLEEEKELRLQANRESMDDRTLETKIDQMWGKVTLFNCYQLFTQLASKKIQNPIHAAYKKLQAMRKDENVSEAEIQAQDAKMQRLHAREGAMWDNKPELDALTLLFNATQQMPSSPMRGLVNDADNALKSMAGAEKMLASVYGIAITAMNFFTDPTIATLTSGTPSQNVDLSTLSFPRKFGVRFTVAYLEKFRLVGAHVRWQAYEDATFTVPLDEKLFSHDAVVTREGWAPFAFDGKFPQKTGYVKLCLSDPNTKMPLKSFYFRFTKDYRRSLDGRFYVKCPVLEERIIKGGQLEELVARKGADGQPVYVRGKTTMTEEKVADITGTQRKRSVKTPVIRQMLVRYEEKPKTVFLVTPPHLQQYAKLILILLKQTVDLNFGQSYLTKANQKPLYKTRYMLDEVGNLQSDGAGIDGLQTMLSIGLGQDQYFTLILQTVQQLRELYGEAVDKIAQGNTSNIVYLKSTDDSMLDMLVKMGGITHRVYTDSMTVTMDKERLLNKAEGKISYITNTKEEPVISYNNLAFMPERNSVVYRAGDPPIWNRNETILPMSWKLLHERRITVPGKNYTVQTIPSLSQVTDFNVRQNMPDFMLMLDKRIRQAAEVKDAKALYAKAYGYNDVDIYRLDPEVYSDELMQIINTLRLRGFDGTYSQKQAAEAQQAESIKACATDNTEMIQEISKTQSAQKALEMPRYAQGLLSRHDLKPYGRERSRGLHTALQKAYERSKQFFVQDDAYVVERDYVLSSALGVPYILRMDQALQEHLAKQAETPGSNVYGEGPIQEETWAAYQIQGAFIDHLFELEDWLDIAKGEFDKAVANELRVGLTDVA